MLSSIIAIGTLLTYSYAQTIVDIAGGDSELSDLVSALTDANLVTTLSGTGPFTVFAPTNDAFAALSAVPTGDILVNVLKYHVLSGEVLSSALTSGLVATTITDDADAITTLITDDGVFFYDSMGNLAEVTVADINATNGVIHKIDAVLLPGGSITDITGNVESLSSLDGALAANSLDTTLANAAATYTLFAPSNDAIAAFKGEITADLLTYHVVTSKAFSTDVPETDTVLTTVNGATLTAVRDATTGAVTVTDAAGNVATVTTANIPGVNGPVHIIDTVLEFRNIVQLTGARSDLTTLVQALTDQALLSVLEGTGPFTVLAPTDTAFGLLDAIPSGDALTNVLKYHVIGANVLSSALTSGLVADTITDNADTVTALIDNGAFFYDSMGNLAQVTVADIVGTNGVIHVIDAVLIPGGTVDDITGNVASLTTLDGALADVGLDATLALTSAEYTLFAPSNDAVAAFNGGITENVLKYHVVASKALSTDVPETPLILTTVNGANITVVRDAATGAVTVTDAAGVSAMVTTANIAGSNGVVHIIDTVLEYRDIVGIASDNSALSTLVQALTDASLVTTLSETGPFTVLAPTDTAFGLLDAVPTGDALTDVLLYHVIDGAVFAADLSPAQIVTTKQTTSITAQIVPEPCFYGSDGRMAIVSITDIIATNGVIHVIDAVLIPGGTINTITSNLAAIALLNGALKANDLNTTLADTDAEFTLFAPNDVAVGAVTGDITADILTYHVVAGKTLAADVPTTATSLNTVNGDAITVMRDASDGSITVTDSQGTVANVVITKANIVGVNGVVHVIDAVLIPDDDATTPAPTMDGSGASMNAIIALVVAVFASLF